jgi:4-amino-4-deoxy-L-arabinose transferase-like glycosyltransferase
MPLTPLLNNRLFQMVFLAYSALLIFLGRHGGLGISNYDDAFYAQKAKEMLASGSFWIVNYHGQPTFENAPLPMWVLALAFKMFGVSDYSVALPSALFGVATVILTYRFAEYVFNDRWTAFLAGAILILPGFFVDYARRGMVDVPLAFFVAAALFCFVKAEINPRWYLLFGLFTAMAVLTKSALGFFPLAIAFAYAILGGSSACRSFYFWIGTAIALALGSSWYIVNIAQLGEWFVRGHFGWILFRRAIGEEAEGVVLNGNPFFFLGYLKALWKNYWPWFPFTVVGFAIFAKRAFRDRDNKSLFIVLWIAVVIGVMSLSKAQVLRYILSAFHSHRQNHRRLGSGKPQKRFHSLSDRGDHGGCVVCQRDRYRNFPKRFHFAKQCFIATACPRDTAECRRYRWQLPPHRLESPQRHDVLRGPFSFRPRNGRGGTDAQDKREPKLNLADHGGRV